MNNVIVSFSDLLAAHFQTFYAKQFKSLRKWGAAANICLLCLSLLNYNVCRPEQQAGVGVGGRRWRCWGGRLCKAKQQHKIRWCTLIWECVGHSHAVAVVAIA